VTCIDSRPISYLSRATYAPYLRAARLAGFTLYANHPAWPAWAAARAAGDDADAVKDAAVDAVWTVQNEQLERMLAALENTRVPA